MIKPAVVRLRVILGHQGHGARGCRAWRASGVNGDMTMRLGRRNARHVMGSNKDGM